MKTIWTFISMLAVAQMLAVGAGVGWLVASGRLSGERVVELRDRLKETVTAEQQRLDAEAAELEAQQSEAVEQARFEGEPLTADERIAQDRVATLEARQRVMAYKEQETRIREALNSDFERLAAEREALAQRIAAFESRTRAYEQLQRDEHFQNAFEALQGQQPKQAKNVLMALFDQGKTDEVVLYLSAMEARQRAKVLAEFEKDDASLAADLLERLRTRAVAAAPPEPEEP